ncbi:MAG TPA: HD domain-containing phosphohydrolase [Gaiellaceae bacterium]|nr:HD domain-containing phosphohydrolase [Gaiellaceae bacterium]
MRILLVDDEPALRELLRVTFEGADVTVDEAASAAEAQARIGLARPDLIVLDLRMPGMGGVELCTVLKASELTREIPIVLLTGADEDEAEGARLAGAEALVRKPFSPLELLAVVERLTNRGGRLLAAPRPVEGNGDEELLLYARDLQHMLSLERRQRALLESSYLETVTALATALEWKDAGTHDHSQRVMRYALELLAVIDPYFVERERGIEYGFLLHDVGKIGIPDEILQKPGPLTPAERSHMEKHTIFGEQMLTGVALLNGEGLNVVRSHHERWDGRGYPDQLRGPEAPLGARVFAVADTLDAMTSDRPYRDALDWAVARDVIVTESGRQFDPDVVDAFRECQDALFEAHLASVAA